MAAESPMAYPEADVDRVLTALSDPACRTLLSELLEPLTAQDLDDRCDLSTSTVYRKLDLLTESGLVEKRVTLTPNHTHTTEYRITFDELTLSLDDDGRLACPIGLGK
ncbi:winged helix-turn-helix domain-containing protein [Natronosalvus vescus]|uniref:winged helix-turn-helix domain-containing protein n=1 Tax=Natronosalvus vescus TaxID=2953881 RepID=UPI0020910F0C|nr:helix-turn-helix domain-containing protein [Natronosalvus vescus]